MGNDEEHIHSSGMLQIRKQGLSNPDGPAVPQQSERLEQQSEPGMLRGDLRLDLHAQTMGDHCPVRYRCCRADPYHLVLLPVECDQSVPPNANVRELRLNASLCVVSRRAEGPRCGVSIFIS